MEAFKASWGEQEFKATTLDVQAIDKWLVRSALEKTNDNQTKAAELLGLTRDQVRYRMSKHGIKPRKG